MNLIDINSDIGEGFGRWTLGDDDQILAHITSANIACGIHAGDPLIMDHTVETCKRRSVSVGAHPGFPDIQGFGRRNMSMSPKEIESYVLYQVGALDAFAQSKGVSLTHVKPHGALYNMAAVDLDVALSIARGIARAGRDLIMVGLAGSLMLDAAKQVGISGASEGFADRSYNPDGTLAPRGTQGAVIEDTDEIARRAVQMVKDKVVLTPHGHHIQLQVDTICIHGDTPGAACIAKTVMERLIENGCKVVPLCQMVGR
jgi:UPF0271 protein